MANEGLTQSILLRSFELSHFPSQVIETKISPCSRWLSVVDETKALHLFTVPSTSKTVPSDTEVSNLCIKIEKLEIQHIKDFVWIAEYTGAPEPNQNLSVLCCLTESNVIHCLYLSDDVFSSLNEQNQQPTIRINENGIVSGRTFCFTPPGTLCSNTITIGEIRSSDLFGLPDVAQDCKGKEIQHIQTFGSHLLAVAGSTLFFLPPMIRTKIFLSTCIQCKAKEPETMLFDGTDRWCFILRSGSSFEAAPIINNTPKRDTTLLEIWDIGEGKQRIIIDVQFYLEHFCHVAVPLPPSEVTKIKVSSCLDIFSIITPKRIFFFELNAMITLCQGKYQKRDSQNFSFHTDCNRIEMRELNPSYKFIQTKKMKKLGANPLRNNPAFDILQCSRKGIQKEESRAGTCNMAWFQRPPFQKESKMKKKRLWVASGALNTSFNGFRCRPSSVEASISFTTTQSTPKARNARLTASTATLPTHAIFSLEDDEVKKNLTKRIHNLHETTHMEIESLKIGQKKIIVLLRHKDTQISIIVLPRSLQEKLLPSHGLLLEEQSSVISMRAESIIFVKRATESLYLHTLLWDRSQQDLLRTLIMFGKQEEAQQLCRRNKWKLEDLPLYSLSLALQHQQSNLLTSCLSSMEDYHWKRVFKEISKSLLPRLHRPPAPLPDEFYMILIDKTSRFLLSILSSLNQRPNPQQIQRELIETSRTLLSCSDPFTEVSTIYSTTNPPLLLSTAPHYMKYIDTEERTEETTPALTTYAHFLRLITNLKKEIQQRRKEDGKAKVELIPSLTLDLFCSKWKKDKTNKEILLLSSLSDEEILQTALVENNISEMISFLSLRSYKRIKEEYKTLSHMEHISEAECRIGWKAFVGSALASIYQQMTHLRLPLAYNNIKKLGIEANSAFLEVLVGTSRRKLRAEILCFAEGRFTVSEDILQLCEWDRRIFDGYPNPYFNIENMKKQSLAQKRDLSCTNIFSEPSYLSLLEFDFECFELSDMPASVAARHQLLFMSSPTTLGAASPVMSKERIDLDSLSGFPLDGGKSSILIPPITDPSSSSSTSCPSFSAYSHYSLRWLASWSITQRELILLESMAHPIVEEELGSSIDISMFSMEASLIYVITYDDIPGFIKWLDGVTWNPETLLLSKSETKELLTFFGPLYHLLLRYIPLASPTLLSTFHLYFAKHAIFLPLLPFPPTASIDPTRFKPTLLQVRSAAHCLFSSSSAPASSSGETYFPFGMLSARHVEVMEEMMILGAAEMLKAYICHYSLQAAVCKDSFLFTSHYEAWVQQLCYIQKISAENIYKAEMAQAAQLLHFSPSPSSSYDLSGPLLSCMVEKKRIWMAVGTCMYSQRPLDLQLRSGMALLPSHIRDILTAPLPGDPELEAAFLFPLDSLILPYPSPSPSAPSFSFDDLSQRSAKERKEEEVDFEFFLKSGEGIGAFSRFPTSSLLPERMWSFMVLHFQNNRIIHATLLFLEARGDVSGIARCFKLCIFALRRIAAFFSSEEKEISSDNIQQRISNLATGLTSGLADLIPCKEIGGEGSNSASLLVSLLCKATETLSDYWIESNECPLHPSSTRWQLVHEFAFLFNLPPPSHPLLLLAHSKKWTNLLFEFHQQETKEKIATEILTKPTEPTEAPETPESTYFHFLLHNDHEDTSPLLYMPLDIPPERNTKRYPVRDVFECLANEMNWKRRKEREGKEGIDEEEKGDSNTDLSPSTPSSPSTLSPLLPLSTPSTFQLFALQQAFHKLQALYVLVAASNGGGGEGVGGMECAMVWMFIALADYVKEEEDEFFIRDEIEIFLYTDGMKWCCSGSQKSEKAKEITFLLIPLALRYCSIQFLLETFSIFLPASPLILFFRFYKYFKLRQFSEAEKELGQFASSLPPPDHVTHRILDDMLENASSPYESWKVVEIVSAVGWNAKWKQRNSILNVMKKTGLHTSLDASVFEMVDFLVDNKYYKEAREFCEASGVAADKVLIRECFSTLCLNELRPFWSMMDERKALWRQLDEKLEELPCSPHVAAEFFYALALRYRMSKEDYIILLGYAVRLWKKNSANRSPSHSRAFLDDLALQIIFLTYTEENTISEEEWKGSIKGEKVQNVINHLLDAKKHLDAQRISKKFKISNKNLDLLLIARKYACNEVESFAGFPERIIRSFSISQRQIASEIEDKPTLLRLIGCTVSHGGELVHEMITQYKICQIIQIPFAALPKRNHYQTLAYLIQYPCYMEESRALIELFSLDDSRVTLLLANSFFKAIQQYFSKDIKNKRISNDESSVRMKALQGLADFGEFLSIVNQPKLIGDRFVNLYQNDNEESQSESEDEGELFGGKNGKLWNHAIQTELLVRAYQSYYFAQYLHGMELVIMLVKSFVPVLTESGDFKLLVRLLTGIHNYIELQQIFNILMENDSFELLLRKDILRDENEKVELRLAIFRYLRSDHPSDVSKLDLLYISFNMHRERADALLKQAYDVIKKVGLFDGRKEHYLQLNEAIVLLCDASDSYAKEKSFQSSKLALDMATLLSIQLKMPHMIIVGRPPTEHFQIFVSLSDFEDARDFANATNLQYDTYWMEALYQQVIVRHNFEYFNHYLAASPVTPQLWITIAEKFRCDPLIATRSAPFQYFLSYLDDQFVLYKLASEFGFKKLLPAVDQDLYLSWLNGPSK